VLGKAVSLASAFAEVGAYGVVAPLWQVEDTRAASYASELYRLARTVPIAEAVRRLRNRSGDEVDATFLTYRFYGHPRAQLQSAGTTSP
jgi:CHAT domain